MQEQALAAGYAVVDHTSIIATHISEVVRSHAHELLTRQETKRLLDALAASQPKAPAVHYELALAYGDLGRGDVAGGQVRGAVRVDGVRRW